MKHKTEAKIALLCFAAILLFIIGMRCGLHDRDALLAAVTAKADAEIAEVKARYEKQIADLGLELAKAREIEHVVYEYRPLPVDYENIGNIQPEESDAVLLAKTMWGEYRDSRNYNQCAAVCWCALNRVDTGYGDLRSVLTNGQYHGYSSSNPVDADLYAIAREVLARWELEKIAVNGNVGRVLPSGFLWMEGDGRANTYRNAYRGGEHITP